MRSRWYISSLIITLTLLGGIASKQQVTAPNQEIVLQFSSEDVSANTTQNAISSVKKQLKDIGIENIEVKQLQDGQLRISYYSPTDVESIKYLLSNACNSDLGLVSQDYKGSSKPSEEKNRVYDFDVYEIQRGLDISELEHHLALEIKIENDRLINPTFLGFDVIKNYATKESQVKVAYKYRSEVATAIDKIAYKIPEVRAGPIVAGILNFS